MDYQLTTQPIHYDAPQEPSQPQYNTDMTGNVGISSIQDEQYQVGGGGIIGSAANVANSAYNAITSAATNIASTVAPSLVSSDNSSDNNGGYMQQVQQASAVTTGVPSNVTPTDSYNVAL